MHVDTYACDHQPVTVLPACPPQDQVSGIPYTLSLDHPDKLMEVGQSCDFTQCKATVKSGGRRCNNFANMCVHACIVPSYILHMYVDTICVQLYCYYHICTYICMYSDFSLFHHHL